MLSLLAALICVLVLMCLILTRTRYLPECVLSPSKTPEKDAAAQKQRNHYGFANGDATSDSNSKKNSTSVTKGSRLLNDGDPLYYNSEDKDKIDYLLDSPIVIRKLYESNDVETQKKYVKKYHLEYLYDENEIKNNKTKKPSAIIPAAATTTKASVATMTMSTERKNLNLTLKNKFCFKKNSDASLDTTGSANDTCSSRSSSSTLSLTNTRANNASKKSSGHLETNASDTSNKQATTLLQTANSGSSPQMSTIFFVNCRGEMVKVNYNGCGTKKAKVFTTSDLIIVLNCRHFTKYLSNSFGI